LELPLYILDIDENDKETFVDAIGLVETPAIESNWFAFATQKSNFNVLNEEKQILAGAAMIPNLPIYRNDNGKEYYVAFNEKSIEKIVNKYFRLGLNQNFNIDHNPDAQVKDVHIQQSFIINTELGVNAPKGYENLPNGTWFIFLKVNDSATWQMAKEGKIKGFSVEGVFNDKKIMDAEIDLLEKVKNLIIK